MKWILTLLSLIKDENRCRIICHLCHSHRKVTRWRLTTLTLDDGAKAMRRFYRLNRLSVKWICIYTRNFFPDWDWERDKRFKKIKGGKNKIRKKFGSSFLPSLLLVSHFLLSSPANWSTIPLFLKTHRKLFLFDRATKQPVSKVSWNQTKLSRPGILWSFNSSI